MRIRKAVGAIITREDKYLLIHKVKLMDQNTETEYIMWDFPKGGIKEEENLEKALLRELKEETGSSSFKVMRKFDEKIVFEFPEGFKYDAQETEMFLVEYTGDYKDLVPDYEEIDQIGFFSMDEVMNLVQLEETRRFLELLRGKRL